MAVDLYFAGAEAFTDLCLEEANNILVSYYYVSKKFAKIEQSLKNYKGKKRIIVDSGAFTAWTRGKVINVDEYLSFLNTYWESIYLCGQIDAIPGDKARGATMEQVLESAENTWENYLYMRSRMKNPSALLYTFHVGEPLHFLERALEWKDKNGKSIPYIALGGMVGKPKEIKKKFLDSCFELIRKSSNPEVKVHAFGMTDFELLAQYPITSADSTSWIMTGANGGVATDYGIIDVGLKNQFSKDYFTTVKEPISHIDLFGETLDSLSKDYKARLRYHIRYFNNKALNTTYKPTLKKRKLF